MAALGAVEEHTSGGLAFQAKTILPVELWSGVVNFLRGDPYGEGRSIVLTEDTKIASKTLKTLSLTCRELRRLSQPVLFETFIVGPFLGTGRLSREIDAGVSHMERLLLWIQERPEFTGWVHNLVIILSNLYGNNTKSKLLIDLVRQFFFQLPHVRKLDITVTNMTPTILLHILQLQSLQTLKVRCNDMPFGNSGLETEVHRSKIKHVTLNTFGHQNDNFASYTNGYTALAPLTLSTAIESLDCALQILERVPSLSSFDPSLFPGLTRLRIFVSPEGLDRLPNPLRACPNVVQFLLHMNRSREPAPDFPKGCLDRLEEYDGPSFIIKTLGIGRPLKKVTLDFQLYNDLYDQVSSVETELRGLASSTVDVEELRLIRVMWSRGLYDGLKTRLGSLRLLEVQNINWTDYMADLAETSTPGTGFPELQRLSIEAHHSLKVAQSAPAGTGDASPEVPSSQPDFGEKVLRWLRSSTTPFPKLGYVRFSGRTWSRDVSSNTWSETVQGDVRPDDGVST